MFLAQGGGEGGSFLPLLMIVALFAILYFLMIRPQQKRRREAAEMQNRLAEGDEVVTVGGLHGTVAELDDQTVILETADGIFSRYERASIAKVASRADEPEATDEPDSPAADPDHDPANPISEQRDKD